MPPIPLCSLAVIAIERCRALRPGKVAPPDVAASAG
jgi:hypothetical protein